MTDIATALMLAPLVLGSEGLTVLAASRDSDAGLRFATLVGKIVNTALDKGRNARWHRAGAGQRAIEGLLLAIAVVAICKLPWLYVAPGWAVTGGWAWRRFDRAFAVRFGKDADYRGTTAELDALDLGNLTLRRVGTVVAALGAVTWVWLALA